VRSLPRKASGTTASSAESIRSKRNASTQGAIKAKVANGTATGKERAVVRLGLSTTRVITGQDDLSEWSDEELREGRRRDKHGGWMGVTPKIVPKALHDELIRRTLLQANELMRENLPAAVEMLVALATNEGVEAKDRLRAISMILDRVMGKSPDKVEISGQSPWLVALQGGIVTMNGNGAHAPEEDDIDDADFVDE